MADSAWYEIKLKDNFSAGIKNAEKNVDQLEKKIKNLGNESNNTGNILRGVFGGVTLANLAQRAASAIKDVTFEVINLGFQMEKTRITMKTLLGGDKNFSNAMIGDFQQFAKETPFSTKEVVEGAKRLAAYQFQAEEMIPTLKRLGDVASGLDLNLNDLIWVYGTTKVAGKVNARDIRQFQDRGIPITEFLSKATGKSQKEILGGLKDIDFKDIVKAFTLMTEKGGPFFNLMNELSKSVSGKWERLKDSVEIIMTALGERLLPYLGQAIDYLDSMVQAVDNLDFSNAIGQAGDLLDNIKSVFVSLSDISEWTGFNDRVDSDLNLFKDILYELKNFGLSAAQGFKMLGQTIVAFLPVLEQFGGVIGDFMGQLLNGEAPRLNKSRSMKLAGAMNLFSNDFDKINEEDKQFQNNLVNPPYRGQNNFFGGNKRVIPATVANMGGYSFMNPDGTITNMPRRKLSASAGDGSDSEGLGMEKIQSGTRNITLNIDKLVGEITFEQTLQGSEQSTIDIVKRVLLTAVNDVNLTSER